MHTHLTNVRTVFKTLINYTKTTKSIIKRKNSAYHSASVQGFSVPIFFAAIHADHDHRVAIVKLPATISDEYGNFTTKKFSTKRYFFFPENFLDLYLNKQSPVKLWNAENSKFLTCDLTEKLRGHEFPAPTAIL